MIAKVRIAPVERWCEGAKRRTYTGFDLKQVEGLPVLIETNSMHDDRDCKGRAWYVEKSSAESARKQFGMPMISQQYRVCEHMLEMD